ncbi:MAG: helix-turn-helix transcriptional regulator [Ruminococcaceae bacterium]|nr:helix-turn-helix transcriptional regulator [Oscillospiraceae bacterium]
MYKRIKDLREDCDLKQCDIAKVINTTQQQYSKIENGKSEPTAEKLVKLAQFYKVSVDYILGLSDKK